MLPEAVFTADLVALGLLFLYARRFPSTLGGHGDGETVCLASSVPDGGPLPDAFVARVVHGPDGARVGETVRVQGDELILKDETRFLAVPLEAVDVRGGNLVLRPDAWDRDEAERAGETWREDHEDELGAPESPAPATLVEEGESRGA